MNAVLLQVQLKYMCYNTIYVVEAYIKYTVITKEAVCCYNVVTISMRPPRSFGF